MIPHSPGSGLRWASGRPLCRTAASAEPAPRRSDPEGAEPQPVKQEVGSYRCFFSSPLFDRLTLMGVNHLGGGGGGGGGGSSIAESESSFRLTLKRETKVLKTLSVIMGVFVCCWLPFFILNCMVPFCEESGGGRQQQAFPCISPSTFDIFVWFGWANSSLNPIIYAFNADFRKAFSILLGCHRLYPGGHNVETVGPNKK